jgi:type IV secretory pathway TrbD component
VLWLLLGGLAMLFTGTTLRRYSARRDPAE